MKSVCCMTIWNRKVPTGRHGLEMISVRSRTISNWSVYWNTLYGIERSLLQDKLKSAFWDHIWNLKNVCSQTIRNGKVSTGRPYFESKSVCCIGPKTNWNWKVPTLRPDLKLKTAYMQEHLVWNGKVTAICNDNILNWKVFVVWKYLELNRCYWNTLFRSGKRLQKHPE